MVPPGPVTPQCLRGFIRGRLMAGGRRCLSVATTGESPAKVTRRYLNGGGSFAASASPWNSSLRFSFFPNSTLARAPIGAGRFSANRGHRQPA